MTTAATLPSTPSDTELDALTRELARPEGTTPNPRRNGKIARLPQASRDMLNRMLDDGLPYHVIIDELGEAGQGLNAQNITNWVRGGYQDYLRQQEAIDRAKAQVEFGLDLLQELGDVDLATIRRACNYVAALQLLQTLRDHGDETLKKLFEDRPGKYLHIVHTLCHQSNAALKLEKFRSQQQLQSAAANPIQVGCSAGVPPAPGTNPSTSTPPASPSAPRPKVGTRSTASPYSIATPPSSPIKAIQAADELSSNCDNQQPSPPIPLPAPASSSIKPIQAPNDNPANGNPLVPPTKAPLHDAPVPSSPIKVVQAPDDRNAGVCASTTRSILEFQEPVTKSAAAAGPADKAAARSPAHPCPSASIRG